MKKKISDPFLFSVSVGCAAAGIVFVILSMLDIGSRSLTIGLLLIACANIFSSILLRRAAVEKRANGGAEGRNSKDTHGE